jgi:glycosyltransferase involved in cell wall biosynthesis
VRIGLLAPVWFPVPPTGYGGIEWIVSLLADGLVDAGHEVTLFANGESRTKGALEYVFEKAPSEQIGLAGPDIRHVLHCLSRQHDFDLINDHSGLIAAMAGGALRTPFVHTVHGPLDGVHGAQYAQLASFAPHVGLISISLNQRRPQPDLNWIANCPNALDFDHYPFAPHRGDYLVFLGRMSPDKGAHRAVRTAIETGLPLKLAGKMREPLERQYFDEFVRPHLSDQIEYLGEVPHGEKVELLQNARVTLFPIEWEEPFGLVMIESMACGTPVVAPRLGAVPEVIESGRSGVIVDDWVDAVQAIEQADAISPETCRAYAEERFARDRLVRDYVAAYETALEAARSQYRRRPSHDIAKLKTAE